MTFLVCVYKLHNFAQCPLNFAMSHNTTAVTFKNCLLYAFHWISVQFHKNYGTNSGKAEGLSGKICSWAVPRVIP